MYIQGLKLLKKQERQMLAQTDNTEFWKLFTEHQFLHNELWRWAALFGALLTSFIISKIVAFFIQRHSQKLEKSGKAVVAALLLRSMVGPVQMLIIAGGLYFARNFIRLEWIITEELNGSEKTREINFLSNWINACKTISVLAVAWFIYRLVDVIEYFLHHWTSKTDTLLDDQLVPLVRKSLRVFIVIVSVLFIAQNIFEWNIGSLIAGLGIGGLAFALAAKDMLANLFGSVTIFADRPFQLGERVVIAGYDGMIEEVGFRSTRLRLLNGHLVTIPNGVVANSAVENIDRRPSIKRVMEVTCTYDTPPEKIQRGVDIIRELLDARKENFPAENPPRVYFNDFGSHSLDIIVYYWFTPADWWAYLEFNHDFNSELLKRFNEEGIEFAFPTQTLYMKKGDSE